MTINSYDDLNAAVANWLARDDLTGRIPDFIALAEAKFNRQLRCVQMESRAYATVSSSDDEPEFIALPMDFQTMRRVRISSADGKPRLDYLSGEQMDEQRTRSGNVAGTPRYFTTFGNELELFPTPSADLTLQMIYRGLIPQLSSSNQKNWLITLAPDLYLYGALLESAPYIKEDARIQVWGSGMTAALEGLNALSIDATYGSPLQMRVSGRAF